MPICTIFNASIPGNWISNRIVKRLELKQRHDKPIAGVTFEGKHFKSNGDFVEIVCFGSERGARNCRHRMFIVNDAPFDMLLGADKSPRNASRRVRENREI